MNWEDLLGRTVAVGTVRTTLAESVGGGKEGHVYRITVDDGTRELSDGFVVKVFEEDGRTEKRPKIEAMVDTGIEEPVDEDTRRLFAWPAEVVRDAGTDEFIGYLMPRVTGQGAQTFARGLGWNGGPPELGYLTALNFAVVIAALHEQGHAMRDMNHGNALIDDGHVSLIDCDGFYVSGPRYSYPSGTFHDRYAPPTIPDKDVETPEPVRRMDRFGLAVHIFQLLMGGFHPFQAKGSDVGGSLRQRIKNGRFSFANRAVDTPDAAPRYELLPGRVRALFEKCFEYGKRRPHRRPTARNWIQALGETIDL